MTSPFISDDVISAPSDQSNLKSSRGGNEYPHLLRLTSLPLKTFPSRRASMTSSTHIQCRGRSAVRSYSARAAQHRWSRISQLKTDDPHAVVYRPSVSASGKDEVRRLQQVTGPQVMDVMVDEECNASSNRLRARANPSSWCIIQPSSA